MPLSRDQRANLPAAANGRPQPASQRCDAVVIGTGIGGLTAAAILARAGMKVLAVERHDRVGGYAHSFRRGPYLFDAAVHLVGGCEQGGLIDRLLRGIGAGDRCRFEKVDPCYRAEFPGFAISGPTGSERFAQTYADAFPNSAPGIEAFLQTCGEIRSETQALLEQDLSVASERLRSFPSLHRYRRATVADVLDEMVDDEKARAALTTLWPYVGLPPASLSFLYWASMLLSYVADGAYYCKGTFQSFADTLAEVVRESGGEVRLRTSARRIEIDSDGVAAVELDSGEIVKTGKVLSNADLRQTVEELVGVERFPARYRRSLDRLRPSTSAVVAYIATDLPAAQIATAHETFAFDSWDHDESYRSTVDGLPSWYSLTVPSEIDPDLGPAGETLLVYTTLVSFASVDDWRANKERYRERIVSQLERRVPGFAGHIKMIELGTPQTMVRYTKNSDGALYGWELSPSHVGPGRPDVRSPVPGLYLAGHWTRPGGGIYGVVTSGMLAARAMLGAASEDDLWRLLA